MNLLSNDIEWWKIVSLASIELDLMVSALHFASYCLLMEEAASIIFLNGVFSCSTIYQCTEPIH